MESKTVKGKFSIKSTPAPTDETLQALGAMRMRFDKTFEGDLSAQSTVAMIGIMDQSLGSGGYVAMERVTGTLSGKKGSFNLQHSCTMARGQQQQQIIVVPDSGTDELAGLTGHMTIEIEKSGQHYYTFEFSTEK